MGETLNLCVLSLPLASKCHLQPSIYVWSLGRTRRQARGRGRVVAVLLAELQWASTSVPYLALSTCPGESPTHTHL